MNNKSLRNEIYRKVIRNTTLNSTIQIAGIPMYVDLAGWGGHLRLTHQPTEKTVIWQPYMNVEKFMVAVCAKIAEIQQIIADDEPTEPASVDAISQQQTVNIG